MKIGTYYYPEQWPREQWERDFDNIAAMGLQIVHLAEFAWFDLEPSPGQFRFGWLDRCLELAAERRLDVILCTPTAAPPIWLADQFPDTLPKTEKGWGDRFGGRRHYTPTSRALEEAAYRIVTAMADHFGQHPSVIGWQIDNEYGSGFDQSPQTHRAFQRWLAKRYGTISELNRAWANQFWNTYYTDFDQILMPPERTPRYNNPHHHLDASRFWSDAFAEFNRMQAEILRRRIGDRFITTNFMPFFPDVDPAEMAKDLTLMTWDAYPVNGWDKEIPDQTFRMADPAGMGFVHDQMASYHGRWGLMELQPGQVNWSGVPVRLYPGAVRLWIWTAFAHGAEFVTTYRFRQPLWGIELFHHGLMQTDGVTPSQGGREFIRAVDEVAKLDLSKVPPLKDEPFDAERTVGILMDFEQLWYYATLPQAKRWDQPKWLRMWYAAITRLGLKVRIVHPHTAWPEDMRLLIAPGVQMVDDELVARLESFARKGGELVLTCRTALMDRNGRLFEGLAAAPILPLIGATIEAYDGLPEGSFGQIESGGAKYKWGAWGDQLVPAAGTEVLATYADQFYAGAAAVTRAKAGDGRVTYCGVYPEPPLIDALLERVVADMNGRLRTTPVAPRVQLLRRGPYRVLLNFRDETIDAPAPDGARFVIGSKRVGPADVAVWEE